MQIESLKNNNLGISFSSYYTIDEKGKRTGIRNIPQQVDYYSLLKTNDIGNLTGIYDVRKFGKVFFKNIKHEDYVFWLGLFKSIKTSVSGISEPLAEYRIHSNSVSSNKFKAALWTWNIHRNVEQLSLPKSLFFSSCYVFNALIKRLF